MSRSEVWIANHRPPFISPFSSHRRSGLRSPVPVRPVGRRQPHVGLFLRAEPGGGGSALRQAASSHLPDPRNPSIDRHLMEGIHKRSVGRKKGPTRDIFFLAHGFFLSPRVERGAATKGPVPVKAQVRQLLYSLRLLMKGVDATRPLIS